MLLLLLTLSLSLDPGRVANIERVLNLDHQKASQVLEHAERDRLATLGQGRRALPPMAKLALPLIAVLAAIGGAQLAQAARLRREAQAPANVLPIRRREVKVRPAVDPARPRRSDPAA